MLVSRDSVFKMSFILVDRGKKRVTDTRFARDEKDG